MDARMPQADWWSPSLERRILIRAVAQTRGTDVAQRSVRAQEIVFPASVFDHNRRGQCVEHLAVNVLVAQPSMEAFDVTILPRNFRLDVECLDRLGGEPMPGTPSQ